MRRSLLVSGAVALAACLVGCGGSTSTVTSIAQRGSGADLLVEAPASSEAPVVSANPDSMVGGAELAACDLDKVTLQNMLKRYELLRLPLPVPDGQNGWKGFVPRFIDRPSTRWAYDVVDGAPSLRPVPPCV